jgi:hypothetical protein
MIVSQSFEEINKKEGKSKKSYDIVTKKSKQAVNIKKL